MRGRYKAGDRYDFPSGCIVWCETGSKSDHDIRVKIAVPDGGVAAPLVLAAVLLDMLFEAEDIARERPQYVGQKHFKGWKKLRDYCNDVYVMGFDMATAKLRAENAQLEIPLFIEADEDGEA